MEYYIVISDGKSNLIHNSIEPGYICGSSHFDNKNVYNFDFFYYYDSMFFFSKKNVFYK